MRAVADAWPGAKLIVTEKLGHLEGLKNTNVVNAVVSFLLIAAAVYYAVVVPVNALTARRNRGQAPPDPTTKKCPECLSEVPIAARRCAFCTSTLG